MTKEQLLAACQQLLTWLNWYQKKEPVPAPPLPVIPPPTPPKMPQEAREEPKPAPLPQKATDRLYAAAKSKIGYDLSRIAIDDVGCAESLSRILKLVYPDFPTILSTAALNDYLRRSPNFRLTLYPQVGCVTIFPTEGKRIGHCGVWGKTHVMSNTSRTGKWEPNYTHAEWTAAADKRGLPVFHYIPL